MLKLGLTLTGFVLLTAGIIIAAILMGVPVGWIAVIGLLVSGAGLLFVVPKIRREPAPEGEEQIVLDGDR